MKVQVDFSVIVEVENMEEALNESAKIAGNIDGVVAVNVFEIDEENEAAYEK